MSRDMSILRNSEECPNCKMRTFVIDSRSYNGIVRRRRMCKFCNTRFNTYEVHEENIDSLLLLLQHKDDINNTLRNMEVILNGKSR